MSQPQHSRKRGEEVRGWQETIKRQKEQGDRPDKQRRSELEERQFGKRERKELDKVVIC